MSEFVEYLTSLAGVPTFFCRSSHGNNGDELIRIGTEHALMRAGVNLVVEPSLAGHIVFQGSGDFMDDYGDGYLRTIQSYSQMYPECQLTMGPSTFAYERTDVAPFLANLKMPLVWFARECQSVENLSRLGARCRLKPMLSKDCALELSDSDYIRDLLNASRESQILIAMRKDVEGNGGILTRTHGRWLPKQFRGPLSKARDYLVARRSRGPIGAILRENKNMRSLPRYTRDISSSVSFEEFETAVADSALIITNRLHVGILGYLLGKRVYLQEGSYFKIRAIYEMSLADKENVTLIPR